MAEVNVTYKGENILKMQFSGEKALKTQDKYCEDDFLIKYDKEKTCVFTEEEYDSSGQLISVVCHNNEHIRPYAFVASSELQSVSLPETVSFIDDNAFFNCPKLTTINLPSNLTYIGDFAFGETPRATISSLPDSVSFIGAGAFLRSSISISSFPSSLTAIKNDTFWACVYLKITTIPKNITSIGEYAFAACAFSEITFEGTPESIATTAFYDCDDLLTINVPWSRDKVFGAPWGATNATVNYNY